jgi:hypothetical protein
MGQSKELDRMYWEESFLDYCDKYENGNLTALDVATKFRQENDYFETMINMRKSWMDEYREEIADESEQYGRDGYNGYIWGLQSKKTYDFKSIPEWLNAKNKLSEIEEKGKLALQLQAKGIEPVDSETGELLPIPQVKQTTYLKCEKSKNK